MEALLRPSWPELPARFMRVESRSEVDQLILAFYRWHITLELADSPAGGVLVTASLTPLSLILRAAHAISHPAQGPTVVAREVVHNADDVSSILDRLSYAIRRHRSVAPFLAGKWRERGVGIGPQG